MFDRREVGSRREYRVVQHLRVRRVEDAAGRASGDRFGPVDEVVADGAAGGIIRRPLDQAERNLALTVDERISFRECARGGIPHQNGRSRQLALRGANVPKQIVADDPIASSMNVNAIRVGVTARRLVFYYPVLDQSLVQTTTRPVPGRPD